MKRSQQHSLFEESGEDTRPLADRMRPTSLDEVVGQSHQIGPGKALRSMIEADRTPSMIFWGPPGVGKTTLARVIARHTHASFIDFSAVTSGIKEIREVMKQADAQASMGRRTIVFVDEIHRFNKAQQDAFLPFVEKGSIILIGATTENPSFEVNNALLSRCKVFVLHGLTEEDLVGLMRRALEDPRGFGGREVRIEEKLLRAIATFADGDARVALSTLEMVVLNGVEDGGVTTVGPETVRQLTSTKSLRYDKDGEEHYNIISALHKSMRNSDPDAAVYWLARMLEGGEDPCTWRGESRVLPPRTWGSRTRTRWRSRSTPSRPRTSSACPSARSTSPRRSSTCRWRPSRIALTSPTSAPRRTRCARLPNPCPWRSATPRPAS